MIYRLPLKASWVVPGDRHIGCWPHPLSTPRATAVAVMAVSGNHHHRTARCRCYCLGWEDGGVRGAEPLAP